MTSPIITLIGGTGMLGGPIARALLRSGVVQPDQLRLINRSGSAEGFDDWPGLEISTDAAQAVRASQVVILCVPPAQFKGLTMNATGKLVLSVMAGVTIAEIEQSTGAKRVIRAMSSPAAENALAYSPFVAAPGVTTADKTLTRDLLSALGQYDEVENEDQIDVFTALTGPVPGFVAYFAQCMGEYATRQGVDPQIADRAIRQLFLASGHSLAHDTPTAAAHVQGMIDYAGTTAAGLIAMQESPLSELIGDGIAVAVAKAKSLD